MFSNETSITSSVIMFFISVTMFPQGMSEYKEDSGSVSTYLSSRARLNKNENEEEERKLIKHKKWTDALTKPALDYSELFPEVVNGSVGQVS